MIFGRKSSGGLEECAYQFKVLEVKREEHGLYHRDMVKVEIVSAPENYNPDGDGRVVNLQEKWAGREFKMPLLNFSQITGRDKKPKINRVLGYDFDLLIMYLKSQRKQMESERLERSVAKSFVEQDARDAEDSGTGVYKLKED